MAPNKVRLCLIGPTAKGTLGAYLQRAGEDLGCTVFPFDCSIAHTPNRTARAIWHRFLGDYPLRGSTFNRDLRRFLSDIRPHFLLTIGRAPVFRETLRLARTIGTVSINFAADDPWNPLFSAKWFFACLREYDVVASPRPVTFQDFKSLGVQNITYAPFGYCPHSHRRADGLPETRLNGDVFFAGGCDSDRVPFFSAIANAGIRPLLFGGYWDRYPTLRPYHKGFATLDEMSRFHASVPISVCLVRRANRDSHAMRTYEAAAMGACLIMEDTTDHRALFGPDGLNVLYFSDSSSLVAACRRALADPALRCRLRAGAYNAVHRGKNTYADRLDSILAAAKAAASGHSVVTPA